MPTKPVRTSGIREKLRSNILKDLARERSAIKSSNEGALSKAEDSDDDEELDSKQPTNKVGSSCSLLSILPKPKNADVFGPSVKLDKLLKMPKRADEAVKREILEEETVQRVSEDGMLEVNVSKMVNETDVHSYIKELTKERAQPPVIVPKGKEKQKNQITYLAQLGKATELERKEQNAQSRINKNAARSKYGW